MEKKKRGKCEYCGNLTPKGKICTNCCTKRLLVRKLLRMVKEG